MLYYNAYRYRPINASSVDESLESLRIHPMDEFPPETLALPSGPARVEWRRSARARRVSLRIDPTGGSVIVTLPLRASRKAGMALLMGHADWVANRLAALPDVVRFIDGATVPIGGGPRPPPPAPPPRAGALPLGPEPPAPGT